MPWVTPKTTKQYDCFCFVSYSSGILSAMKLINLQPLPNLELWAIWHFLILMLTPPQSQSFVLQKKAVHTHPFVLCVCVCVIFHTCVNVMKTAHQARCCLLCGVRQRHAPARHSSDGLCDRLRKLTTSKPIAAFLFINCAFDWLGGISFVLPKVQRLFLPREAEGNIFECICT